MVADMRAHAHTVPPRLWAALVATMLAFVVSLLASLNLYLLEDDSPLTQAAYSAAPLLRFSYDGVYLSALVAGVAVCAIAGYAAVRSEAAVLLGLAVLALLVALGGFGGLLVRHPATFLVLFLAFAGLILASVLAGRAVAARMRSQLGRQPAALLGACVSAGVALLVNLVLLVPHTIALNPVSHPLYMQGRIGGTRLNSLLIAMAIELLTVSVCALSIGAALRGASRSRGNGGTMPLPG